MKNATKPSAVRKGGKRSAPPHQAAREFKIGMIAVWIKMANEPRNTRSRKRNHTKFDEARTSIRVIGFSVLFVHFVVRFSSIQKHRFPVFKSIGA